jgi:acetamidase/formamidase
MNAPGHGHATHTIHHQHRHRGWNRDFAPVLTIAPGESIEFDVMDASDGQFNPQSTAADVSTMDFGRVNPTTGPVYVDGAEPGDILKVTLLEFMPSGWGWTANIPGFGLLADQFTQPALRHWHYDTSGRVPAAFGAHAKVPLKPHAGCMGCALAEPGLHSIVPPRRVGGNIDIRDLSTGATLYLPVEVKGALFSLGDTHAAQGDGEVCGTAIESPIKVAAKLELIKQQPLEFPRFTTPGPVTRHLDEKGYDVTTGVGPDLMTGARDALRQMVDFLARTRNLDPVDAYILCSVCADLRITEIVDQPNWMVSVYFPRVVFE